MSQTPKKRSWWQKLARLRWRTFWLLKKPADFLVAVWECILWFLGKPTGAIIGSLLLAGSISAIATLWGSTAEKSLNPFITSLLGLLAIWLGFIRFGAFIKQNRADALNRCLEQMGNQDSASMRIAGIRGLAVLAQEHRNDSEFLKQVRSILQDFLDERAPARQDADILKKLRAIKNMPLSWNSKATIQRAKLNKAETAKLKTWHECWQKRKAEVEQAIHSFGRVVAMAPRTLSGPDLSYRYLPNLKLRFPKDQNLSLHKSKFIGSFLLQSSFWNTDLQQSYLWNMNLRGASLLNADLKETNLWDTDLRESHLYNTRLRSANLRNADLREALLQKIDLAKARLWKTDLSGTNLTETKLKKAYLFEADLSGANLKETDFRCANLSRAVLLKAKFHKSKLRNADFDKARLMGAVHYKSEDDYNKDFATTSLKHGIPITRKSGWLKAQGAKNWEKAKFSDDSKK